MLAPAPALALDETADSDANSATDASGTVDVFGAPSSLGLTKPSNAGSRLGLTPIEIPATVQILSGDTIRELGDISVLQAETQAAGITSTASPGNGNMGLGYRGFNGVNAVMQLFDGTQLAVGSGTITFPFDPWTVDRIEVLGGPASVLYGVGAIGGTVNVVPRKPNTEGWENEIRLAAGSFNSFREAIDSTGPISSNAAYRLDISRNSSDGWIDRGDSDSVAFSGTFQFDLAPEFRLSLSEDYGYQSPMEYWGTPLINGVLTGAIRERNFTVQDSYMKFTDSVTQFKQDWAANDSLSLHNNLFLLLTHREWHDVETYSYVPATRLINRTGYFVINHNETQIGDHGNVNYSSTIAGLQNDLTAGFDFNTIHFTNGNTTPYAGSSTVNPFNFTPGNFVQAIPSRTTTLTNTDEYAVFVEDRLKLLDNFSLVVGSRFDVAHLEVRDPSIGTPLYSGTGVNFNKTFHSPSYRVGVVYNPLPDLAFYAQYATATAALGSLITTSVSQVNFKLATGDQIEVGVKQDFWDKHGEFTLAAYRIVQNNLLTPDPLHPTVSLQVGQQSSQGFEASLAVTVFEDVKIEANGTVLKAKYDDFSQTVSGVAVSRAGKTPPNAARQAANVFARWQFLPDWQVRAGAQYVGHRYADMANALLLPSYTIATMGIRWAPISNFSVDLRMDNAFDSTYPVVSGNGGTQWYLGQPRSVEATVNYKF